MDVNFTTLKEHKPDSGFRISYDKPVAKVLNELGATLAITTYQAGKLIFISPKDEQTLRQTPISFKKPMGLAILDNKLAVATLDEIQLFSNSTELANTFPHKEGEFDALYLPRATYYCGETDLHDMHFAKGGLWAVNTLFSCISSYDINYSFVPRWKPSFVSHLRPEDRCHLNGMATIDKVPAYVTALGETNKKGAWREHITTGGLLMKVPSGEIVLKNLPMPHSPRIYKDELYLLLSASGEVVKVNPEKKSYEVIFTIPGFIRGLAIHGDYMFVGQSKVRKSSKTFSKLPVATMADAAGVLVFDLKKQEKVGEINYHDTVDEIFDVQILPGMINPGLINDERHKKAVSTEIMSFWKRKEDEAESN